MITQLLVAPKGGNGLRRSIKLNEKPQMTFGSSKGNADFKLGSGDDVSRHHCTITFREGKFFIVDESTNGTFVNGKRIESGAEIEISHDDIIQMASVAFRLEFTSIQAVLREVDSAKVELQVSEVRENFENPVPDAESSKPSSPAVQSVKPASQEVPSKSDCCPDDIFDKITFSTSSAAQAGKVVSQDVSDDSGESGEIALAPVEE